MDFKNGQKPQFFSPTFLLWSTDVVSALGLTIPQKSTLRPKDK